ncbi:MAG TPA: type I 3-dehydroquinate dehydratase [Thermoanaerobaculia bacterium]|nr:type I 3-dehydroquinate dehydratase [Thermoanaerobaculia bacterium]
MKLFVTILEETCDAAIAAIRALRHEHDGVEVRAERFPSIDLQAIRAATDKPIILTYRTSGAAAAGLSSSQEIGGRSGHRSTSDVLAAGMDFIDIEWRDDVEIATPERTVLSHHDYEGMRDLELIFDRMRARDCAHTKLAATPLNFEDNLRLLSLLQPSEELRGIPRNPTVIGMGERGLYSRILAPFKGAALTFVAASNGAAPGQLTLERALDIYGGGALRADKVFAVAGNPAGHSLSPAIHNQLFRQKGVPAAYTIASVERFGELADAFLSGEPCGLSVTTPFKDDAFMFARARNFDLGENALRARAVNTLVNLGDRVLADNTDVDGFAALLPRASKAAIVGAGGTARAARVALENAGIAATIYNRTASKGDAPLAALADFDGDLIINTLPSGVDVTIPPVRTYIEAAYGGATREVDARQRIGGLELLHAQAIRQHELFMKVFDGL